MTETMTRTAPPLIERSYTFDVRDVTDSGVSDGLTLRGHAVVFGQQTEINSWEGSFVESVRAGATKKTIRERTPVLQFDHGRHPLIGSIPLGTFSRLEEDATGLYVEARLVDNWLVQPVRDAVANGSVNGMSFRFEVVRDAWKDAKGKNLSKIEVDQLLWNPGQRGPLQRELIELRVPELGPVVFPAYSGTDVSVRDAALAAEIMRDPRLAQAARRSLAEGDTSIDPASTRGVAYALLSVPLQTVHSDAAQMLSVRTETQREGTDENDAERGSMLSDEQGSEIGAENVTTDSDATSDNESVRDDAPPDEGTRHDDAPLERAPVDRKAVAARHARMRYVAENGVGSVSHDAQGLGDGHA